MSAMACVNRRSLALKRIPVNLSLCFALSPAPASAPCPAAAASFLRTVLVDNNTWNNTHIATVGRALASSEERSYPILLSLDVDYVLLIFGGMIGYQVPGASGA
jgi:hypothetical protein